MTTRRWTGAFPRRAANPFITSRNCASNTLIDIIEVKAEVDEEA